MATLSSSVALARVIAEATPMYSDFRRLCSRSIPRILPLLNKGRERREAAGEGAGDAPPSDDDSHAPPDDARNDRHSGVGRNPEGAGDPPAPPDPADVPLDRFFIRF